MTNPLISIVIPVYNASETIEECLKSIFNQSYKNLEIIAVNDGSNDESGKILEKYLNQIKIITQNNAGAAKARNAGAKLAIGEYIIFIDADSTLNPKMIEKMLQALLNDKKAAFAYSSFKFGFKNFYLWPFDPNKLKEMPYIHTSSLIRKSIFPGFDESLKRFQDWDLYLTISNKGHYGVFIPEILFTIKDKGTMSSWLPKFIYRLPFLPVVKKYKAAEKIIKEKHKI